MSFVLDDATKNSLEAFRLPSFNEIPGVGLYLNQTAKFINQCLDPIELGTVTESMISNYVKKHLVESPIKKQYSREQIALLMFIAVAKNVVSLDDISLLLSNANTHYSIAESYEYFRVELEGRVKNVFGIEASPLVEKREDSLEKELARNILLTVAHTVYLRKVFVLLGVKEEE